jgi:hypothetical protein
MSTAMTANERIPVKFCVQSSEARQRDYLGLFALSAAIILLLCYIDPNIQNDLAWILGGLGMGVVLLETSPVKRNVELSVEVGPLGVQRTTTINDRIMHHPLLPKACIKDCIITEHVKTFSVSSNLVFRVESSLVPVFPDADLSFRQCEFLLKQIQRALREQ